MGIKVAINGFGRIGRLAFRVSAVSGASSRAPRLAVISPSRKALSSTSGVRIF